MYFYNVILTKTLPVPYLVYSSNENIRVGTMVEVPLRNRPVLGVIRSIEKQKPSYKTKEVSRIYPVTKPLNHLKFLDFFGYNTFNSINSVYKASLQAFEIIAEKHWKQISEKNSGKNNIINKQSEGVEDEVKNKNKQNTKSVNFFLEKDTWFRIKYIIRSSISKFQEINNQNKKSEYILIIVPEQKVMKNIAIKLKKEFISQQTKVLEYSAKPNQNSRITILQILDDYNHLSTHPTLNILLSTKSGIFIPIPNLTKIVLLEEASSFYIQDQNGLYYDTRDAAFILSQTKNIDLDFVSTIPSVRLYKSYPEDVINNFRDNNTKTIQKPLKMQIIKRDNRTTFSNLFSELILEDIGVEYKND